MFVYKPSKDAPVDIAKLREKYGKARDDAVKLQGVCARQDKTRQDTTRHDKTRQDKA